MDESVVCTGCMPPQSVSKNALFRRDRHRETGEVTRSFSRSITPSFNLYDNLEKLRMSIMYGSGEEAVAKCDRLDTEARGLAGEGACR